MSQQQRDVSERWIDHIRKSTKTTKLLFCPYCADRRIFSASHELWAHTQQSHPNELPTNKDELDEFRRNFEAEAGNKRPSKDDSQRKPVYNESSTAGPEPPPIQKRPLSHPLSGPLRTLNLGGTQDESADIPIQDLEDDQLEPRKRAAIGMGISEGSASPSPFRDSESPPPRRAKARTTSDSDVRWPNPFENVQRPHVQKGVLWTPDQEPLIRPSHDPSNIAALHAQKSRNQALSGHKPRKALQSPPQQAQVISNLRQPLQNQVPPQIFGRPSTSGLQVQPPKDEAYDIVLQPETRPISQEQLVAEVKGIYAGLVMVEAKCIEVDNKQATLASSDPGVQPKLNNEQWQALIALHRTLLHEHHDFFLASQHPSASPALRRLASKYAMPARMWRHGIHSFLELLRHRLPASLDHMLAFIYLAYSMMALLYETVPAFEDTWIECLGDLGRYRMAIEDDDIRDREVWTGVARHWYSKASDKAPTTGRLYHHLAILARPNALQQLFYYAKSLCVVVPFTSARESILTLFDPVLTENGQSQYRLPPLDAAFVKSHGLLFTNKEMHRFEIAVQEFLALLDNQIGRVTRKFMEQGYQIAIANCVSMLSFASKDSVLMKAISSSTNDDDDVPMEGTSPEDASQSMVSFKNAERLSNATLRIVLERIGDPNVLSFIHVTLVFVYHMSRYAGALSLLRAQFPLESLAVMLNTLLVSCETFSAIESDTFPLPEKDDVRPFPEDFAMRGLLWADNYFPKEWFNNEKVDEEEKYHERASMTAQRKERILWLAVGIARSVGSGLKYEPGHPKPRFFADVASEASKFAPATTASISDQASTWPTGAESEGGNETVAALTTAADPHV